MTGEVKDILITDKSGGALHSIASAKLEVGKGIVGDRYHAGVGAFSNKHPGSPALEVSLIEQEEIVQFNLTTGLDYTAAELRRNIVTEDIRLNDLVGREFYIGTVKMKGIKLCEPCGYLAKILSDEVMTHLLHRGGLRAQVLSDGDIHLLDRVGEK